MERTGVMGLKQLEESRAKLIKYQNPTGGGDISLYHSKLLRSLHPNLHLHNQAQLYDCSLKAGDNQLVGVHAALLRTFWPKG